MLSYCLVALINTFPLHQIIEGAFTLFLGILSWFFIPDFPHKNRFLTVEQTEVVLKRVNRDRGDASPDIVTLSKVVTHLSDWTLWAYGSRMAFTSFIVTYVIFRAHVHVRDTPSMCDILLSLEGSLTDAVVYN